MTTPSHHPPGKESVIILLIVCPLSQSYRRIVVSVVFVCRIESEPPVIVEQATLILTTLLAVIITIACLKETLLSSLCQDKEDQIICCLHISSQVAESKGKTLVLEKRGVPAPPGFSEVQLGTANEVPCASREVAALP